ncbi:zinc-dependent alcohol dehydrogenase family protein [Bacteroidota bacterium]
MKAQLLDGIKDLTVEKQPLIFKEVPTPEPGESEVLLEISTCGVCHTELDEIEGRTPPPRFPVIPGHQVVGKVINAGYQVTKHKEGDRVGVAWINAACGVCDFCISGKENLCSDFKATGRDLNGGYAEYMVVGENFAHQIPKIFSDEEAAPLLCAGAIGYRSLNLTGLKNGQLLGLTGFGASAHLVLKMVKKKYPDSAVFVFARSKKEQEFAIELGATWAGDTESRCPELLHAIIDTTPVWKPVVEGLLNIRPGGRLVINAIRKENHDKDYLLKLDYEQHLWMEKEIKSVANVANSDVSAFLELAASIPLKPEYQTYSLEEANKALLELKNRKIRGAKVLKIR